MRDLDEQLAAAGDDVASSAAHRNGGGRCAPSPRASPPICSGASSPTDCRSGRMAASPAAAPSRAAPHGGAADEPRDAEAQARHASGAWMAGPIGRGARDRAGLSASTGERYSSLSSIAREITGTSWSGPRFFGLTATDRGAPWLGAPPSRRASGHARVRCAIYTRKSTEEGLEQEFNSLDAQREACAAYIAQPAARGLDAAARPL